MNTDTQILANHVATLMWVHFLQLTLVMLIVWAVIRLVARNRPHIAHTLWLLVIIKAITPPVATTNFGLFPWLERSVATIAIGPSNAPLESARNNTPTERSASRVGKPVNGVTLTAPSMSTDDRRAASDDSPRQQPESTNSPSQIIQSSPARHEANNASSHLHHRSVSMITLAAWLLGAVACFSTIVVRSVRAIAQIKSTREPIPQWLVDRLTLHSEQPGIKPRLWLTSSNFGPVAFGLLRPTIAIPSSLIKSRKDSKTREVDAILAHEVAHLRRHDLFVGWLQVISQSIWWFHPLVWFANRNLSLESERCCDEEAVGRLGCTANDYVRGLLNVLEAKRSLRAVPVLPGIRPVEVTKTRLERIMSLNNGYRTRTPVWCGLLLLAASAFCIPGSASATFEEAVTSASGQSFRVTPTRGPTDDRMPSERIRLSVHLISGPTQEIDQLFSNWKVKPFRNSNAPVFQKSTGQSIRKQTPVLWSPVTAAEHQEIIDAAQNKTRLNVHSAGDTVRATQSLRLADMTQHPFVVGMEDEPIVSTVESGFAIELTPEPIGAKDIRIQFKVELAKILAVERLTITRPGQSPISIQVPKVARIDSAGRPTIDLEETLLIGGIRHLGADDGNEKTDTLVDSAMIIAVKATVLSQADAVEGESTQPIAPVENSSVSRLATPIDSGDLVGGIPDDSSSLLAQTVNAAPWDLSRVDCLRIALKQSRPAGVLGQIKLGKGDAVGSIRLTRQGAKTDAEIAFRHLVLEVEKAYWNLHFYYRNLDAAKVGRDSALLTWRAVNAQLKAGSGPQADAASVAQSQEQYFFFRGRVEEAKRDLKKGERRLRFLCRIATDDGRTIRPIDEPDHSERNVVWEAVLESTLQGAPEIKRQRTLMQSVGKTLGETTSVAERAELEVLQKRQSRRLEDIELELTHSLTDSVQSLRSCHNLVETTALQSLSAKKHVDALRAQFKEGTVTLDFLLDAQRRLADARVAYYRSLTQYEMAKLEVAYRSNSLLNDRKLTILEPAEH